MSDVMAIGDEKPTKNLFQKLINKETLPTLYAAFSGLSWFSGFLGISTLAGAIYNSFDNWLGGIAGFFARIFRYLHLFFDPQELKIILMYSGVFIFGYFGIIDFLKKKKIFYKNSDAYKSLICLILMLSLFVIKVAAVENEVSFIDKLSFIQIYIEPYKIIATAYVFALFIPFVSFYILTKRNFSAANSYLFSIALCAILLCATIYAYAFYFQYLNTSDSINYSAGVIFYVVPPFLFLALNPKRLRQITMFGILFVGLAAFSAVLEKVFPTLVNTHIS